MTSQIKHADAQHILDTMFAAWVRALKPQVTGFDSAHCTLTIPVTPEICRVGDIVSGQAMATLADTAMVLACIGHLDALVPVSTVTLDTQFLRPCSGETLDARAEVTRAGRSMIFARCALISQPSGKEVALATATFARPPE